MIFTAEFEDNFKPGRSAESGFIAEDEQLQEVIERDANTLAMHNIGIAQIVNSLQRLVGKAKRLQDLFHRGFLATSNEEQSAIWLGEQGVLIEQQYDVQVTIYRGFQECPFGPPCGKEANSNVDFKIRDTKNNKTLSFAGLMVHLIDQHQFFEGSVPYRLAPEEIIAFFELVPEQKVICHWEVEKVWKLVGDGMEQRQYLELRQSFPDLIQRSTEKHMLEELGLQIITVNDTKVIVVAEDSISFDIAPTIHGYSFRSNSILQGTELYELSDHSYVPLGEQELQLYPIKKSEPLELMRRNNPTSRDL